MIFFTIEAAMFIAPAFWNHYTTYMPKSALWIIVGVVVTVILGAVILMRTGTMPSEEDRTIDEYSGEMPEFVEIAPETTPPGGFLEPTPSQSVPPQTRSVDALEEKVVSVDETGFTPKSITVTAGTAVTFINNGQALHWPASDPHPTHTGLPGFDAQKGLATAESYTYTFEKTGTWPFHDHLSPSSKGTVIVQ